jgi:hypothetical protein
LLAKVDSDRVLVDVVAAGFEVGAGEDLVIGVSALPNIEFGAEAMRKAATNMFHGAGKIVGGEKQVDVVGHDDEGVEFVEAFTAIVLERVEEEMCVGFDLEESAAVGCDGREEECA